MPIPSKITSADSASPSQLGECEDTFENESLEIHDENLTQQLLALQQERDTLKVRLGEFSGYNYFAWAAEKASGTTYGTEARKFFSRLEEELTAAELALANNDFANAHKHIKVAKALAPGVSQLIGGLAGEIDVGASDLTKTWKGVAAVDAFVGVASASAYFGPALVGTGLATGFTVTTASLGIHATGVLAYEAYKKIVPETKPKAVPFHVTDIGINTAAQYPISTDGILPAPTHKLKTKEELTALAQQALRDYRDKKPSSVDMAEFFIHAELAADGESGQQVLDAYLKIWERRKAQYAAALEKNDGGFSSLSLFPKSEAATTDAAAVIDFKDDVQNLRGAIIGPTNKLRYTSGRKRFTDFLRLSGDAGAGVDCQGQGVPFTIVYHSLMSALPSPYVMGYQAFNNHGALAVLNSDPKSQKVWDVFYNRIDDKIKAPIYHAEYLYYTYLSTIGIKPVLTLDDLLITDMNVPEPDDYEEPVDFGNSILKFPGAKGDAGGTTPDEAMIDFNAYPETNGKGAVPVSKDLAELMQKEAVSLGDFDKNIFPSMGFMDGTSFFNMRALYTLPVDAVKYHGYYYAHFNTRELTGKESLLFFDQRDKEHYLALQKLTDPKRREKETIDFLIGLYRHYFPNYVEKEADKLLELEHFLRNPGQFARASDERLSEFKLTLDLYERMIDVNSGMLNNYKIEKQVWDAVDLDAFAKGRDSEEGIAYLRQAQADLIRREVTPTHPVSALLEESVATIRQSFKEHPDDWAMILDRLTPSQRRTYLKLWDDLDEKVDSSLPNESALQPIFDLFNDQTVIGVAPPTKSTKGKTTTLDQSDTLTVTWLDESISDDDVLAHNAAKTKLSPEPETAPEFIWDFKDATIPKIQVSPQFIWDLMTNYQGHRTQSILENWTPAMSAAFFEMNKDGEYDTVFMRIYLHISEARQKRYPQTVTGPDILVKRLKGLRDTYATHGIDLLASLPWSSDALFQEYKKIIKQYQLPTIYQADIDDIQFGPLYKTESEKKGNFTLDMKSDKNPPNFDPNYFGLVPLDFVPILADILRRRKKTYPVF